MLIEEKIFSLIAQSKRILLISHRNPDPDTLGSAGTFFLYLQNLGKDVQAKCVSPVPESLSFLRVLKNFENNLQDTDLSQYDLVIALDCGDLSQTGIADKLKNRATKTFLINIDHHFTNNGYGDLNLVNPEASSTCEVVYQLFKTVGKPLTREMTNCLLSGILSDTTYFSNAATTIESIQSASDLLLQGASLREVTNHIWRNKNLGTLRSWGKILDRLIFNAEYQIAIAIITLEDLQEADLNPEAFDGLSNFLTSIYDARVVMVLSQVSENTIKGSLRTTRDDVDVSRLAQEFGGGGHKKASGFTVHGRLGFENGQWGVS